MESLSVPWTSLSISYTTLIGLSLIVFALLFDWVKHRRRGACYPPGPLPLPVVGNMFDLDVNNFPDSLAKLKKKYGNIFSLQLFWDKVVVLNGFAAVKEALVTKSEDTSDRPPIPIFEHLGLDKGFAFTKYSQHWKEQRRFVLYTLKNFGMGRKTIEERVREEAGYLCSAFQAEEGHPFNPLLLVNNAISNVICSIIFGERFDYSDKSFQKMIYLLKEIFQMETGLIPQMLNIFPWLMKIPGPHMKLFAAQNTYLDFLKEIIRNHKDTWDPAIKRDFIDAFFEEIEKAKDDPQSSFNERTLLFTTADIFVAGTETTSSTLRWALLMMLLHPHIQSQVHEEIDRVIGRDRLPTMEDQRSMPFTNAVVHETQRYANILPMALFHMTCRDIKIQGYNIPKGTTIIPNLTSVLKDENVWEKPYQFYPKHFLDAEGRFVKKEEFIPFSAGKRACVGEPLARMELFLFFTSLLQHFDFQIPRNQPRPSDVPVYTFNLSPQPFQICALVR
ncbi:cytochrome P450 2D20-like [Rhinophrynus dorsalis]